MITGVGFLLFCFIDGFLKIFTVRELKSKPAIYKEAGMLSFPLETYEETDGDYAKTIERLLKEEVGIPPSEVAICRVFEEKFKLIPGREDVETAYGYGIFLGNHSCTFIPCDDDIEFGGWMSIKELLTYRIRVEVEPIIKHFLSQGIAINP